MAQVYFHCSDANRVLPSRCVAEVDSLADARAQAATAIRMIVAQPGPEDWRCWVLHVSDDLGEEILMLPFSAVMGRPH